MTEKISSLMGDCRRTVDAAVGAVDWFAQNASTVRQEAPQLMREFRRYNATARRLLAAVERPMCVGVFGPSQSGKSYLISALARKGTNPLMADFEGIPGGVDFVRRINPEGGKESTGLVTRFSIRRQPTPPGYPVALRLLTQTDIVKILGNMYFSDCDEAEEQTPSAEKINEVLNAARAASRNHPVDVLTEDDVFDIQDYFEQRFKSNETIKALQAGGFWLQAAEIAPRLSLNERVKLWALLWGDIAEYSRLYSNLFAGLEQLGFADVAHCGIDALVKLENTDVGRRNDSIIDVTTLNGLGSDAPADLSMTTNGRVAVLPRPTVTALVAELRITMHEQPWPFFEHTDLLDFPGARSREKTPRRHLSDPEKFAKVFLRGKVAYLFQRYSADQELTSMLLCIKPGPQDVATLPESVKEWIDATHGPTPAMRAKSQTALFFVLTKFDEEFVERVGDADSSEGRWTARLDAALLDFFGRVHDWPLNWHPGRAFDNTYWLRNPGISAKHILDYTPPPKTLEIGIRASEKERLDRMRGEYLNNAAIRTHIADPERAWDEAFRLNDGGVGYLAERLAPVCNPEIKLAQIDARLRLQRRAMHERCARFFVGGDLAEQRAERLARADEVIKALGACARAQRFGKLMLSLQLRETDLADILYRVKTESELSLASSNLDPIDSDRESRYSDAILSFWFERLRILPATPPMCRYFLLTESNAENFVGEIVVGARRTDLRGILAQRLRDARGVRRQLSKSTAKPALLAAECINSYVTWLGYAPNETGVRPTSLTDKNRPVFPAPPVLDGMPNLGAQPSRHDLTYAQDWCSAYRQVVDDNARDQGGQMIDVEQNRRLGTLLTMLETA